MRVIYHNWSATKQRPHPQSAAVTSRHPVLSGDRTRQCETPSRPCHKDTDQCPQAAIPLRRHRTEPALCENGSAETTAAEGGRNPVAGLWSHTLGENRPPEPTSSHAPIDPDANWLQIQPQRPPDVSRSNGGPSISGPTPSLPILKTPLPGKSTQ